MMKMMFDSIKRNNEYKRIEVLDINICYFFKNIMPSRNDLGNIKNFIEYISLLNNEYNKHIKNKSFDKILKKDINIIILNRAKHIRRSEQRKVFWINNNVYILEKVKNKNIISILYCNENGQHIDKLYIRYNFRLNIIEEFFHFINKVKINNTTFETSSEFSCNMLGEKIIKHKIIIKQYDSDRIRGAFNELIGDKFTRNFERFC